MSAEEKKLTDEEEALLREFEEERSKQNALMDREVQDEVKRELADEIKSVMEKEVEGAMTTQVNRAVEEEMNSQIKQEVEFGVIGEKTTVIDAQTMRREMEAELRGKIEEETRIKFEEEFRKRLEEEARKKVEETRVEIEAKIRKEMEEKEKIKKEEILKKLHVFKQMDDEKLKLRDEELKIQIKEEMTKEIEERDRKRKEEILKKLLLIEKVETETKHLQEEEMKTKMKDEIKKEMEEERARKKQEILSRLDSVKTQSLEFQQKLNEVTLNYNEMSSMIQLFEEAQEVFLLILSGKTGKKAAQTIFFRAVLEAEKKMPEVLKRVITDKNGNLKNDGILEAARLIANINALQMGEPEKAAKFTAGLREIFDGRIIAAEVATNLEIKHAMVSDLITKIKQMMQKGAFGKKINDLFMSQVVPNTSLNQGD
jgi:hypothetical protein